MSWNIARRRRRRTRKKKSPAEARPKSGDEPEHEPEKCEAISQGRIMRKRERKRDDDVVPLATSYSMRVQVSPPQNMPPKAQPWTFSLSLPRSAMVES